MSILSKKILLNSNSVKFILNNSGLQKLNQINVAFFKDFPDPPKAIGSIYFFTTNLIKI